jgi:hypothetical protein
MCAAFIAAVGDAWTAYAETEGWDILLVRNVDGFQIGVQAKLRLNIAVLNQVLEDHWPREIGPDCRAVLVPEGAGHIGLVADYIGITIIRVLKSANGRWSKAFLPDLPKRGDDWSERNWHELVPMKRHALPEYVPDVTAGAPAPLQLTAWKINALKIAFILEQRGYVTRADFKAIGIDYRRWLPSSMGWLTPAPGASGFVASSAIPDFKRMHPSVYAQVAADAEKWMPTASLPLTAKQEALSL